MASQIFYKTLAVEDNDASAIMKLQCGEVTSHQIQIGTDAESGVIEIQGRSEGAPDYGKLGEIDLADGVPAIKIIEGVYTHLKFVNAATGVDFNVYYTGYY